MSRERRTFLPASSRILSFPVSFMPAKYNTVPPIGKWHVFEMPLKRTSMPSTQVVGSQPSPGILKIHGRDLKTIHHPTVETGSANHREPRLAQTRIRQSGHW